MTRYRQSEMNRWVPFTNQGSYTIPANYGVEITGASADSIGNVSLEGELPTVDEPAIAAINGNLDVLPGGTGAVTFSGPVVAAIDTAGSTGNLYGVSNGGKLEKGLNGWTFLSSITSNAKNGSSRAVVHPIWSPPLPKATYTISHGSQPTTLTNLTMATEYESATVPVHFSRSGSVISFESKSGIFMVHATAYFNGNSTDGTGSFQGSGSLTGSVAWTGGSVPSTLVAHWSGIVNASTGTASLTIQGSSTLGGTGITGTVTIWR